MSVKVNRIELDKGRGLTIQVRNGASTQTIFLDGEKLTLTVEGPGGPSIIEQTPTTVTVTADNFIVNAKTIVQSGSVAATMRSGASSVALAPEAAAVTAPEIALTASANINALAPTVTVTGSEAATVAAPGGAALVSGMVANVVAETSTQIAGPVSVVLLGPVEYL